MLLIDQFEEILSTNLERWDDRQRFFEQLGKAMRADPMMWVVFVLREDYIAALDPYARLLPGKMSSRFYMQRMAKEAAWKAITLPAEQAGRPFEDDAAEELVNKLLQIRVHGQKEPIPGHFVEPVRSGGNRCNCGRCFGQ